MSRVFANGPEDLGSIPSRVIPKTLKIVLDNYLLNTQQYKVRIKGKVEQSKEKSNALPSIKVANFIYFQIWNKKNTTLLLIELLAVT